MVRHTTKAAKKGKVKMIYVPHAGVTGAVGGLLRRDVGYRGKRKKRGMTIVQPMVAGAKKVDGVMQHTRMVMEDGQMKRKLMLVKGGEVLVRKSRGALPISWKPQKEVDKARGVRLHPKRKKRRGEVVRVCHRRAYRTKTGVLVPGF